MTFLNPKTNKKEDTYETSFKKLSRTEHKKELDKSRAMSNWSESKIPSKAELGELVIKEKAIFNFNLENVTTMAKDSDRDFPCPYCPERFFYKSGLGTHLVHAHSNSDDGKSGDESGMPEIPPPCRSSRGSGEELLRV